ncbi:MAG: hypothetical protein LBM98_01560 [Oscillospiraceae bacterium]|nr:hypothetical protein [Oscillospiraceae bacterium]
MRYVVSYGAKQSSAGNRRYVSFAFTTGLLRRYTSFVSHAYRGFAMTVRRDEGF